MAAQHVPPEGTTVVLRREAVFSGWLMASFESMSGCQLR
jgi:hypothetical protein